MERILENLFTVNNDVGAPDTTSFVIAKVNDLETKLWHCSVNDYDRKQCINNSIYIMLYNCFQKDSNIDHIRLVQSIMYSKHLMNMYNHISDDFLARAKSKLPVKSDIQLLTDKIDEVLDVVRNMNN